jgi:hypothetical protein
MLPTLFLVAAREVPGGPSGVHDTVVLTKPNARGGAGRKRPGFLDVNAITVSLDQMKAQADFDANQESVRSAWLFTGRDPTRVLECAWIPPKFWVSLTR